jgi:hypothetical protein
MPKWLEYLPVSQIEKTLSQDDTSDLRLTFFNDRPRLRLSLIYLPPEKLRLPREALDKINASFM